MKRYWPSLLICAVVVLLGYVLLKPAQDISSPLLGQHARAFELLTLDRQKYTYSGATERPLVLNFWASYCLPCRQEAPVLRTISQKYRDQVDMLGVVFFNDDPLKAKTFLADHRLSYPNVLDVKSRVAIDYGIAQIPVTVVIDPDGTVVYRKLGAVSAPELEQALQGVLN